ncbi:MAG: hypothetical protein R3250_01180 [Melioribacteraceae bacterium]|nr:hypothetical protein [Melioribacteraceae bacterium]
MNKPQKQQIEVQSDASLDFKKHDWYFEELKILLIDFIQKYNSALIGKTKPDQVYLALNSIYLWASDQFEALEVSEELQKSLEEIKSKVLKGEKGTLTLIYNLFLQFNKYLSKTENKPKVRINREDEYESFWRTEEVAGLREMKKAFYDSFMLPED